VRGWCDALATPRALGPLIDILAELSGEQAAGVRAAIAAGDPEAIHTRLLGLFGDGNARVWVIEDVHWADGATLDLLRFLARRIDALPVLLVVSHRDDEIGPTHPLALLLGDVATTAAVTRIALDRLSRDAVAVLAAGSGVNAGALYRFTGGNPSSSPRSCQPALMRWVMAPCPAVWPRGTQGPTVTVARCPLAAAALFAATHEVRCAAETSPLTRLTSLTEVYLNAADPKLFEGIGELAAASDGNDIAILAFGDWEAEGECAVGGAALPLSKRRGGEDLALAVLNGDGSVMADVGVSVRSLARCPV